MCSRYINNGENEKYVKNNTYRYKKMIKEKSSNRKMSKRLEGIVKRLEDDGQNQEQIEPIINLARVYNAI